MEGKTILPSVKHDSNKPPLQSILAGGISGGLEVFVSYPIGMTFSLFTFLEYIKTQLQLQDKKNPYYNGIFDCVKKTVKKNGFFGLYTGLSPLFYMSIPKVAVRFSAFEESKKLLQDKDGKLSTGNRFIAGLSAGVCEGKLVMLNF